MATVPQHALLLGWFQEGLEGCELVDNELFEFCKPTNKGAVDLLCKHAQSTQPVFAGYAATLHAIGEAKFCNAWILANF